MNKRKNKRLARKCMASFLAMTLGVSSLSSGIGMSVVKAEEENTTTESTLVDSGLDYDYARALQYSMYFYDANMCGTDVDENSQLSWRGDCHTNDAMIPLQPMDEKSNGTNLSQEFIDEYKDILDPDGDGYVDVSGGMHDAGDHVKFGMPENYTAATLGWGYYEFRDSYEKLDQTEHIETILRYFNDYLMKCTFRDEDGKVIAHCYQVGDGDIDHAYWQAPEVDSMSRPAFFLNKDKPYVDYLATAAASLVINYFNFKDTDPDYAAKSLDYGKALWDLATELIPSLAIKNKENPNAEPSYPIYESENGDGPKRFYTSNEWKDDYCWAGTWLYEATEEVTYLNQLVPYIDYYAPSGWCYCWDDMWSGAITKLAIIDDEHPELDLQNMYRTVQGKTQYEDADFWKQIVKAMDTWMNNYTTAGGYAFLSEWGSARYNTAMQFITLIYEKYHKDDELSQYTKWAESQMKYIMGNNPLKRCYIVGYNEKSVKFPHHRAASGLLMAEDPREHKHVLYGALVGGPDGQDNHNDVTSDWRRNEVTIDYNAAFVGASAALYEFFGTDDMAITKNFPPVEVADEEEGGSKGYWVEAFAVDDLHEDGAGVTKVSLKVMTNDNSAKKDISVKYFFNTSEISDISKVDVKELYDQASAEEENADGVISGPFKYENLEDTYYYEITWDGYTIANSGKKYQACAGMYWGDFWDPTNDYSYQGLPVLSDTDMFANGNEVETPYICVYSDGTLVGGIEPDGTTASGDDQTSETTADTKKTTEKPDKTTASADKTTASADKTTASADKTTASADKTTASADKTTASADKTTASAGKTTASADKTTASADKTTASASKTTASADKTTASADKTTASADKTTASAGKTTASADKTTASADKTTASADKTTASADKTTASADKTTASAGKTTASADKTTASADKTTTSADKTTASAGKTTASADRTTQRPSYPSDVTEDEDSTSTNPGTPETTTEDDKDTPGKNPSESETTEDDKDTPGKNPSESETTEDDKNNTIKNPSESETTEDDKNNTGKNPSQSETTTEDGEDDTNKNPSQSETTTEDGEDDTNKNPSQSETTTEDGEDDTNKNPSQSETTTEDGEDDANKNPSQSETTTEDGEDDINKNPSQSETTEDGEDDTNKNPNQADTTTKNPAGDSQNAANNETTANTNNTTAQNASGQTTGTANNTQNTAQTNNPSADTSNSAWWAAVEKWKEPPVKVSGLKFKGNSKKGKLSWKKISGVTGYKVYRYSDAKEKYVLCKTTAKNSITLKKLKKNTTYRYKVRAYKKSSFIGTVYGKYSKTLKLKVK